jgi:hypothetical protein
MFPACKVAVLLLPLFIISLPPERSGVLYCRFLAIDRLSAYQPTHYTTSDDDCMTITTSVRTGVSHF